MIEKHSFAFIYKHVCDVFVVCGGVYSSYALCGHAEMPSGPHPDAYFELHMQDVDAEILSGPHPDA